MEISDLNHQPRLVIEATRSKTLQNLTVGQVIEARVISPTQNNRAILQIGRSSIEAQTSIALQKGEQLVLDVTKAGRLPELRLRQASTAAELHAKFLRIALPKQAPLHPLFNKLRGLLQGMPPSLHPATTPPLVPTPPGTNPAPNLPNPATRARVYAENSPPGSSVPQGDRAHTHRDANHLSGTALQTASASLKQGLSPELIRMLGKITKLGLESPDKITPEQLRQSLAHSGLFLEANLAQGTPPPAADLKANLLQLLLLLNRSIPAQAGSQPLTPQDPSATGQQPPASHEGVMRLLADLQNQTEGALARIQMHQLASVRTDDQPRQAWQFELPINQDQGTDNFMLRVEREGTTDDHHGEALWFVNMEFNLAPLGVVSAKIGLTGMQVSTHFTAEQQTTANKIEEALPKLDQAFTKAGLQVLKLSARQGRPQNPVEPKTTLSPLLDEKA